MSSESHATRTRPAWQPLAVIGMAGVFPGADDLAAFHANLAAGRDGVRRLPEARRIQAGLPAREHIEAGYLERIDAFDHAFFGISRGEADAMDPQQRVALQLAVAAVQDAGYDIGALRGSHTAVVLAAVDNGYARLAGQADGAAVVGNTTAAIAGKLSYHFDWRGPALLVDTSCSSSLVAVHDACARLLSGEADLALAGGLSLYVFVPEAGFHDPLGIAAADGRCKTFDARADGTGIGEGAGLLLLKTLARARADRDVIHAVILGGAVNHDGGRSNGMAAPSPAAQTEVIREAWRRAGIAPETVGAIEAHGTGTQLGDPIEVQALHDAFEGANLRRGFCALGSVKTNIGHLGAAAGVAGVVKAVSSLRHRMLYPSLHYRTPNPHIAFDDSPLYVNTQASAWPAAAHPRRIGVSAFGISGTNAHVVLEEAPTPEPGSATPFTAQIVKLGARTPAALARLAERLEQALRRERAAGLEPVLADLAYTLAVGRDDQPCRAALVVRDLEALLAALGELAAAPPPVLARSEPRPVYALVSGAAAPAALGLTHTSAALAPLAAAWARVQPTPASDGSASGVALALAVHEQWRAFGLRPARLLGSGHGNLAIRAITGTISVTEALAQAMQPPPAFDEARFAAFVRQASADDQPLWVEWDAPGPLTRTLRALDAEAPLGSRLRADDEWPWLELLACAYRQGAALDWTALYAGQERRRLSLPSYPFEPVACFARAIASAPDHETTSPPAPAAVDAAAALPADATSTERAVGTVWLELLRCERLGRDDDFFELGGGSLHFVQMQSRLRDRLHVELDFETLLEQPTLRKLAAHLERAQPVAAPAEPATPPLRRRDTSEPRALSFAQERLYYLYRLEPGSPYYNMPAALLLEGALDAGALEAALQDVVARHEVLRSTYATAADGRVQQQVQAEARLELRQVDLCAWPGPARDARLATLAAEEAAAPFDLGRDLALRATLVRLEVERHALLLTMHHIASDGWSVGVLGRELGLLYAARRDGRSPDLPNLPAQYADYAEWQRAWLTGPVLERQRGYWQQVLADAPRLSTLPSERPRPASSSQRGAWTERRLAAELRAQVEGLARQAGGTAFMVMLAGFFALLQRQSGQSDLCVGTPVANRVPRESEALIGFFANTLALRVDLGGNPSFLEIVQAVKRSSLGAFAHADLPFEQLVQFLGLARDARVAPLFQIAFAYQNVPLQPFQLDALTVSSLSLPGGTARFDLALSVVEDAGGFVCLAEYSRELFDDAELIRLLERYERLLSGATRAPETRLAELPLLSPEEHDEVLQAWSQPASADAYRFD